MLRMSQLGYTPAYDAVLAETVTLPGNDGHPIEAYLARPLRPGPRGGVIVFHHFPGFDAATKEIVRRLAVEGYDAIAPNLFTREAPGAAPDDAYATVRAMGGVPDLQVVGDGAGCAAYLRGLVSSNGKVGTIGYCSGGRHSFLVGCSVDVQAVVDCYGAWVMNPPAPDSNMLARPIIDLAPGLTGSVLGLFGVEDRAPSPDETAQISAELTRLGKDHEFHTFDEAGHGFFAVDRPSYRPAAAVEGWRVLLDFYRRHLS
jgi:carboxymethylenebutenolidase